MPQYIEITEDEAWAIDHTIRHTYTDGQSNVGKTLLLKVMNIILEFEDRRGKPFAPQVLPLAVTEEECWAIDHQIRCDLTVNGKPVGRALLLKVFRALTEFANQRDSEAGVQQLGALADLLRAPADEEFSHPDDDGGSGRRPSGPGQNKPQDHTSPPDGEPPDNRRQPDDGATGPLPRGK
jgi:hypothetical protein